MQIVDEEHEKMTGTLRPGGSRRTEPCRQHCEHDDATEPFHAFYSLIGRRVERSRLGQMQIDIWSDIVCPWCYLGKRRFEKALAGFGGRDDVRVAHRSFQLDPTRGRGETSRRRAMLQSKYRLSEDQVRAMDHKMEQMAAAEGLEYHLTDAGLTGNTLDAHQLVHLAARHGLEDEMLERLYK